MKTIQLQITLNEDAEKHLVDLFAKAMLQASEQPFGPYDEKREARLKSSRNALFGGQKPPEDMGLLIDAEAVGKLIKVCGKTVLRMSVSGRLPPPVKIGRATRWSLPAIKKWVDDGCPICNKESTKE